MTTAQILSEHHGDSGSATSDAAHFMSDEMLVALAKMGHRTVFDELYKRHAKQMFRVAQRITRHREDSEDAVQECFTNAYLHLRCFDGRATFRTWLTRIAINAALMKVRKNRVSREVPFEDPAERPESGPKDEPRAIGPNPEDTCAKGEQEAALKGAILKLRPLLREAVDLHQLQELSLRETAKVLGISVSTAKGRIFHARAALRRTRELNALRSRGMFVSPSS
jgi:RNA polymerase sigma-70 factor (ECF subfamily)